MQSTIIAMVVPEDSGYATMLVRRGDGQFAFERIDARVAAATRAAPSWRNAPLMLNLAPARTAAEGPSDWLHLRAAI